MADAHLKLPVQLSIVAAVLAFLALLYAARPVDRDHTYGHEKIEFFSSGVEGGLIFIARAKADDVPDYNGQIAPLFAKYCTSCHNGTDCEGKLVGGSARQSRADSAFPGRAWERGRRSTP